MIIDVTGVELSPWDSDKCLGNGEHIDENGNEIECCCEECDYYLCCISTDANKCEGCYDLKCPKASKRPVNSFGMFIKNIK